MCGHSLHDSLPIFLLSGGQSPLGRSVFSRRAPTLRIGVRVLESPSEFDEWWVSLYLDREWVVCEPKLFCGGRVHQATWQDRRDPLLGPWFSSTRIGAPGLYPARDGRRDRSYQRVQAGAPRGTHLRPSKE